MEAETKTEAEDETPVDSKEKRSKDKDEDKSERRRKRREVAEEEEERVEGEVVGEYVPGSLTSFLVGGGDVAPETGANKGKKKKKKTEEEVEVGVTEDLFSRKDAVAIAPAKWTSTTTAAAAPPTANEKDSSEEKKGESTRKDDDDDDEDHAEDHARTEEEEAATLFVSNVPTNPALNSTTAKLRKALRKHFAQYGKVQRVRLRSVGVALSDKAKVEPGSDFRDVRRVGAVKTSLDSRLTTCNAYVVFATPAERDKAKEEADGSVFQDHHLRVDAVREGTTVFDRKRTVFLGNVDFFASEEDVRRHVDGLVPNVVQSVRVIRDTATNLGKGFAYVLLKERENVDAVIKAVDGSVLVVAAPTAPGDGPDKDARTRRKNKSQSPERRLRASRCERSKTQAKFVSKSRREARKESDELKATKFGHAVARVASRTRASFKPGPRGPALRR